jgi:hypothetical protein
MGQIQQNQRLPVSKQIAIALQALCCISCFDSFTALNSVSRAPNRASANQG